jgi:hypothetical protein
MFLTTFPPELGYTLMQLQAYIKLAVEEAIKGKKQ